MIEALKLKFGRAPGLEPEPINTSAITVFVGPNNSGKSKALREIYQYCSSGQKISSDVIIEDITFKSFSLETAIDKVRKATLKPHANEAIQLDHVFVGKRNARRQVPRAQLLAALQNPNGNLSHQYCVFYLNYNTLILDGHSRIDLVNDQPAGDLQQNPSTSLQMLFRDDHKREEIRRIIHDAFNCYFVIDPTSLGSLRIRLSDNAPATQMEERGIHQEAVDFHSKARHIGEASDGVKAFTGMLTEIVAGDPSILLIDEPEAFLHPALSFKLGKEVAHASLETDKRVFVSTHSPTFVMGCIQSGAPVNIVRLTYRNNSATARLLSNDDILKLMRNPLLRSTGVMSGLFYESVIVTESDADKAFYQEINERLLRFKPEYGIPNCLFINAQNKQTVHTIIRPLRELGIPAAGIVDIDILKEGGTVWTNYLKGGFVPELSHHPLSTSRASIKKIFDESGKDMKRQGGVEILDQNNKQAAIDLFDQLDAYGLFTIRNGELESWLKSLNANGHGPAWLIDVFEKMGEEPEAPSYLTPSDNDVWQFIGRIKNWLFDANRKGIPT